MDTISENPFAEEEVSDNPFGSEQTLRDTVATAKVDPLVDGTENADKIKLTNYLQKKGYDVTLDTVDLYRQRLFTKDSSPSAINKQLTNELSVQPLGPRIKVAKTDSEKKKSFMADEIIMAAKSILRTGEAIHGVVDAPFALGSALTGGRVATPSYVLNRYFGYDPKAVFDQIDTMYSEDTKKQLATVSAKKGVLQKLGAIIKNPRVAEAAIIESIGPMLFGGGVAKKLIGAGVAPQAAAAIGEGVVSAGSSLQQLQQDTDFSSVTPEQAALVASGAMATTLIGYGSANLQSKFGLDDIDVIIASGVRKTGATVKKTLGSMFFESFVEEFPQSVNETITMNLATDKPWDTGLDETVAMSIIVGASMGAGTGFVGGRSITGFNGGPLTTDDIATLREQPDVLASLDDSPESELLRTAITENDTGALAEYNQGVVGLAEETDTAAAETAASLAEGQTAAPSTSENLPPEVAQDAPISEQEADLEPMMSETDSVVIDAAPLSDLSTKARKILARKEGVKNAIRPFVSLTTRIQEIAPKAALRIWEAKQRAHSLITSRNTEMAPFFESANKAIKAIPKAERNIIFSEMLNGEWDKLESRGITGITELRSAFGEVAKGLGISEAEMIQNYFRRRVIDYPGLVEHLGRKPTGPFSRAIKKAEASKGRTLTDEERRAVVSDVLRSGDGNPYRQRRTIDVVTPEMTQFYSDPLAELAVFVIGSSRSIANRELLGVDTKVDTLGSEESDAETSEVSDDSLKAIVSDMVQSGEVDAKDEQLLRDLLKSEINQRANPKFVSQFRRLVSAKYVTKVKTMVVQLSDLFVSMAENNLLNMASKSEIKNLTDELGNDIKLSLQNIDMQALDAELQDSKRRLVERGLFFGLTVADLVGKKALLNSTAQKWFSMAKKKPDRLKPILMNKLGDEQFVDKVISDMKKNILSGDVTLALYAQMSQFHPTSNSEHIKFYIDNPAMRSLFVLQSFGWKQFDRLYREALSPLIDGLADWQVAYAEGDKEGRKAAANDFGRGVAGLSKFILLTKGGEALVRFAYEQMLQAIGSDIPEEEEKTLMETYLNELFSIFPLFNPYSAKKAYDRQDLKLYFEEAYDVPMPIGIEALGSLHKNLIGKDNKAWTKDVPWVGEFLWRDEKYTDSLINEKRQDF